MEVNIDPFILKLFKEQWQIDIFHPPPTRRLDPEAGVAQLNSVWPSELEFPSSTHGDSNVCFDIFNFRIVLYSHTLLTEDDSERGIKCVPRAGHMSIDN